jgi:hypothetical protein
MAAKVSSLLPVTPYIDKTSTFRCQPARYASVAVQKSGPLTPLTVSYRPAIR